MLKKARGLTLIEVLVTLVILLFGLLGLAGLIVMGHRASFEAYQRYQALTIANELAERIKANQSMTTGTPDNLSIANAYATGATLLAPLGDPTNPERWNALMVNHSTPDCGAAVSCTRPELVEYDLGVWEGQLLGVGEVRVADASNIGGIINARGCVEGPMAAPSPPNTYRISVSWQGDVPTSAPTSSACGAGLYRNAATGLADNATRRVVSIDVTIFVPL
jgi:type IV pilus assembly protein PilV